jgi:hypothetical protein
VPADPVVSFLAEHAVVALVAEDLVSASTASQNVLAGEATDDVLASSSLEAVTTPCSDDCVGLPADARQASSGECPRLVVIVRRRAIGVVHVGLAITVVVDSVLASGRIAVALAIVVR